MSIEVKQKIKEVADDFAMPAKKLRGMLMTSAHGQLTTRKDSAR